MPAAPWKVIPVRFHVLLRRDLFSGGKQVAGPGHFISRRFLLRLERAACHARSASENEGPAAISSRAVTQGIAGRKIDACGVRPVPGPGRQSYGFRF